jgi:hypothetical protein
MLSLRMLAGSRRVARKSFQHSAVSFQPFSPAKGPRFYKPGSLQPSKLTAGG